jgi:hypothetical protein
MNEIYLHIGLHKTGNGTLQFQFFPACEGITFLTTANERMKQFTTYVTRTDPLYFDPFSALELLGPQLKTGKKIVLSNEAFSGPLWTGLAHLGLDHRFPVLANLRETFPDARVILVLRRQDELARSIYRQYLKAGGTRPVKRFYGLASKGRPPVISLNRFRFSPYVTAVCESFPKGFLILTYEEFRSDQKAFLRKITDFIGIDLPEIELRKSNVSRLGPFGLEIARLLNFFFRSALNPGGFLPGISQTMTGGKTRVASPVHLIHRSWPGRGVHRRGGTLWDVSNRVFESVQADNRTLDERYHLNLHQYGYYSNI